jgi:signal transduction histidine kinase
MKLFSKLYRLNLLATLSIFILSSVTYYFLIRFVVLAQFDESLQIERVEIEKYAASHHQLPEIIPVKDRLISFRPTNGSHKSSFETVMAYDTIGMDTADFRKLFFTVKAGNQWYQAMVGKSMEGTEHLIHTIIKITIGTILLILVVSTIINRIVLKNLWQPFYKILQFMKDYQVGKKISFSFPETKIEEFSLMNTVLRKATTKADQDYLALKEFTENASHEMQTPLAIIRSKMDLVIQDENTSDRHEANLRAIYKAIDKLTNLNHSLLLLTKIGNNQFTNKTEINVNETLKDKLTQFHEMLLDKSIKLSLKTTDVNIIIDPELLDTLLNNLLSNSIKHNVTGGEIRITLQENKLVISNPGNPVALDEARVFTRFYKSEQNNDFTGLGLFIMKEVCIVSGCNISYRFENGFHFFMVDWSD